jgi:hypothetical protein
MPESELPTHITEVEVGEHGTLRLAGFDEPVTRGDIYEDLPSNWSDSPEDLADAMQVCQPLAMEVNSIYWEFRYELERDLEDAIKSGTERRASALKTRLRTLPEEPEEGAPDWLLSLTSSEFEANMVPAIDKWLGEPPDRNSDEGDYLPESCTAQGTALEFFREMSEEDLEKLGVVIIEGECPGSTYFAAELREAIEEANRVALEAGIPVRFMAQDNS